MKSLSRIYRRAAEEQLNAWDIANLDVDVAESSQGIDQEQILALFGNNIEKESNKKNTGSHSALHRGGTDLVLNAWQPQEIDLQPAFTLENDWLSADSSSDAPKDIETENRKEESISEKENEATLKQARALAEEILQKAQAESDQLILQARMEIEQEKKNGYQQGWNDARSELRESLKAAVDIVDELRKWQTEFMEQGEQTLIEMLKEMAQTMFGEGVQLDPDALQINLNRIMENAQRLGDLNIFLHPRDANLLDPSWKEYQHLISGNKVRVIPSEKITPGGCIIKGNTGMVDGRVETQLAAILNTFDELREVAQ